MARTVEEWTQLVCPNADRYCQTHTCPLFSAWGDEFQYGTCEDVERKRNEAYEGKMRIKERRGQ